MLEPFRLKFEQKKWDSLVARISQTRWPDEPSNEDWRYGANRSFLKDLAHFWQEKFDWKTTVERLNSYEQFMASIDGFNIHTIRIRGKGKHALPLIMTNGWPSSYVELLRVAEDLASPFVGNGDYDCFDVVIPSIPGFGYSAPSPTPGFIEVDRIWRKLMEEELGFSHFVAHGTDIGARITGALGRNHPDIVDGIHLGSVDLDIPSITVGDRSEEEVKYLAGVDRWEHEYGAYADLQGTFPQTVAYALADSPIGLAAWIVEKFVQWSDQRFPIAERFTPEDLLDNIMIYWDSGCINSSMRRYFDTRDNPALKDLAKVTVPTFIAMFPGESDLLVPKSVVERGYDLVRYNEMKRGGHFPSLEAPMDLILDIQESFLGQNQNFA